MQYGVCPLALIPVRLEPSHSAEMESQFLYGEHFKILEARAKWSLLCNSYDGLEGWAENKQFKKISEEEYAAFELEEPHFSGDLVEFTGSEQNLIPIIFGSVVSSASFFSHSYSGNFLSGKRSKNHILDTALLFLNSPFLKGGKSPFGIDSGGLVQTVYRANGYNLFRKADKQASQGESLSFIEESEPGDLAFFDTPEGLINHVGIMMGDNYIIHADGKVRIDRIDHSGIYNPEIRKHTHQLRVIKKII